jgi:hypothetical protein
MDMTQLGTAITAVIALLLSLGGVIVLNGRGKVVAAFGTLVKIMNGLAALMKTLVDAQADDVVDAKELADMQAQATAILADVQQLRTDLGI